MARGSQQASEAVSEQTGSSVQDWNADTLAVALCSDTYAAVAAFVNFSQFTEVTGGSYVETTPTKTFSRSGANSILQVGNVSWGVDPSGPVDVRIAVLYDKTTPGSNDVITVVDLTDDGTTPVSLQANAIAVNFASSPTMNVNRQ